MKIAALVLLLIQSGNRAPAPEMQVWLCPVHADNQSGEPGSCPVCQRPLEQRTLVTAWLCPMHNHIRGEQGGACPVCGMGLARTSEQVLWICPRHAEVREARPGICRIGGESLERGIAPLPHGDHNPRHGGQLFMAPDGFHHVEGALADSGEFHLYFYDNFTRPVDARRFGARVNDRRLQQAVDGRYAVLRSELPLRRPAELTVLVTFDTDREERFDFVFAEAGNAPPTPAPLAAGTPRDIYEEILVRAAQIRELMKQGAWTELFIPALEAKDLALDLYEKEGGRVELPCKTIVRAAWLLDMYGDQGNRPGVESAYRLFEEGVNQLRKLYAP